MFPKLLHIYSDLYINSYGLAIAVGFGLFSWLLLRDPACKKLVDKRTLLHILQIGFFAALIFGRIGAIISSPEMFDHWTEWFMLWRGGFSLLASVLGILIVVPFYLKKANTPLLPFLDRVALYAPLLQSLSRIGCFLAGCCSGKPTALAWAVTYTNPDCTAQLFTPIHPTQLYSSVILFYLFIFLYFVIQPKTTKPGQILFWYLVLMSLERFTVDFFRADQVMLTTPFFALFSLHQWIALGIFVSACSAFIYSHYTKSIS